MTHIIKVRIKDGAYETFVVSEYAMVKDTFLATRTKDNVKITVTTNAAGIFIEKE